MIPYGRQFIDEDDINAVVEVLRSDWLTTGPKVAEFEKAVGQFVGAKYAVAVSSGTAALHCAMYALGIGSGDEVIVPCMTFVATANCVVYQGGTPVFADVDPDTLLVDPEQVEAKITPNTRAIIGVDYAGQPCDWDALREIAKRHNLYLVADGCHALGAEYKGRGVGSLADMTVFSFHPVKHITTGEGGMIVTDNPNLAERMRIFRNHGITRDPKCFSSLTSDLRPQTSDFSWFYEMKDLGYNYRITDIQCALGISQLKKLPDFLARRREIASVYDRAFKDLPGLKPLRTRNDVVHAYHLYVVRVNNEKAGGGRKVVFKKLRKGGIGVNVHYIPVHLHPYYQRKFGTGPGLCPVAEKAYAEIISLPMFPGMTDEDVKNITRCVEKAMLE
jgi:perosamine synthetase